MDLSCNSDGVCGVCKSRPGDDRLLQCDSCTFYWHMDCLNPPLKHVPEGDWSCPDCALDAPAPAKIESENNLLQKIREIQADPSLDEREKARRRQELMSGGIKLAPAVEVDDEFKCTICLKGLDRPVTAPCGHNFCLKCLERWLRDHKNCSLCRNPFSTDFIKQPRINSVLVHALRMSKMGSTPKPAKEVIVKEDRPAKAFTTERAKRGGKSNAACGRMMVNVPIDHFGPIPPESDKRGQGVLVGETWNDRLECHQWGVHRPHVAGISGRADYGAQSVCLSGGYEDDEDHGEYFLYTGSGGRDLSGNKRTNEQSFDQEFTRVNQALLVSCLNGYPVRVVRSRKEKRSAYAPQEGLRYDGCYRIEKCWRKTGQRGYQVCRYLFVRCDNEAAPWTSDTFGDRPRPLPEVPELEDAQNITERKGSASWDWNENEGTWGWTSPPPPSKAKEGGGTGKKGQKNRENELKKNFKCHICKTVLEQPLSTPCGHNFCKSCLENKFTGQTDLRDRGGARSLRAQKSVKRCPQCNADISDFMKNPAVNKEMSDIIKSLKDDIAKAATDSSNAETESQEWMGDGGKGEGEEDGKEETMEAEEQKDVKTKRNTTKKRKVKEEDYQEGTRKTRMCRPYYMFH